MSETPAKKPRTPRTEGAAATKTVKTAAKPAAKPAAKAAPAAAKAATGAARPGKAAASPELRQQLVIETAYYLSEKRRGHCSEQDDWLFAETLVDSLAKALK